MARRKKGDDPVSDQNGQHDATGTTATAEAETPTTQQTNGAPARNGNGGEEKSQPVHKIRIRNVSGAIWSNARQDGTTYLTFTVSRSYRDDQNNWHSATSFGAPDGFILAEVCRQCALWIVNSTQNSEIPF